MLKFPREKWLMYAAWFLIPLAVKSVPELQTPYPIGYDTPSYMYLAKFYAQEFKPWRPFEQFLGLVYRSGVDMIVFMKVFPMMLYAVSIFVLSIYVYKRLKWGPYNTLITCLLLSASPVMLRVSSDLHRQSLALLVLFASLFFISPRKGKRNTALIILLLMLTGLLHEIVFGVLEVILLYNVVLSAIKRDRKAFNHYALLAVVPIITYLSLKLSGFVTYTLYSPVYLAESLRALFVAGGPRTWMTFDWWLSVLILAYGLILPLSALGAFNHQHFTPWIVITLTAYATVIITPSFFFNLPDRWLFLAAPPVTIYAANALAKFRKNLKVAITVALVSVQAVSMLGFFSRPLSVYAGQHYLCFTDTLLVSTTDQQTVDALREVAAWLDTNTPANAIVGAPHDLYRWALYYVERKSIARCDTLEQVSALGYPSYLIWYTIDPIPQGYKPVYHYYPITLYQHV